MKILLKRNCAAEGQHLEVGKVYDLPEAVALELLRIGRAVEAQAEEAKPKATRKPKAEAADGAQ